MTEVVLVTGSSGCIGQHIVKLLQERDDNVKEIRLFDIKPYHNNLGHKEVKPMKHILGDVTKKHDLLEATKGVDCVIHAAAHIEISCMFPERDHAFAVNLEGTRNVIDACIQNSVPRLVNVGTTDMMIDGEHIFYGMESTTVVPKSFSLGPYAESKAQAEELVLKASGRPLDDGKGKLRALSLRILPFYGEEDNHFVTGFLKRFKGHGSVTRIHSLDERMQLIYVGNSAHAALQAKDRLAVDESISGEAFYVTDDTPIVDIYENMRPFVEAAGQKLSDYVLPYWLVWSVLMMVSLFCRMVHPIYKLNPKLPSPGMVSFMCSTIFFNRSKSTLRLNYQPLYNCEEAQQKSVQYYSKVKV